MAAAAATAQGINPEQLTQAGWTCFRDPVNPRIVCLNPGHPRPAVPADPDGQESLQDMIFDLDGSFLGTAHAIRADLYHGQPCPQWAGTRTTSSRSSATTPVSASRPMTTERKSR